MAEAQNETVPPTAPPPIIGVSKSPHRDWLESGESVITIIHRSIIGLIAIYLVAATAVIAILALVIALSPGTFKTSSATISLELSGIFVVGAILLVLILFTATYIYRQSRLIITDRSLIQVMQRTLFNKEVSRLSMSNVEDVKEEQRGIIATLFNYGTLTVQTAGTMENFIFSLCPNPTALADRIIEARQAYASSVQEENEKR